MVERDANVPARLRDAAGARVVFAADAEHVPPDAEVAFPLGTWAERDGVLLNVDGIAQEIRRNRSAGPPGLLSAVEVLEEVLLALGTGREPVGRSGILAALAALPALSGVVLPAGAPAGVGERS
jgi:hypothetical protein